MQHEFILISLYDKTFRIFTFLSPEKDRISPKTDIVIRFYLFSPHKHFCYKELLKLIKINLNICSTMFDFSLLEYLFSSFLLYIVFCSSNLYSGEKHIGKPKNRIILFLLISLFISLKSIPSYYLHSIYPILL